MKRSKLFTFMASCVCAIVSLNVSYANSEKVLSFAVLGDAEPKPEPLFPNVSDAVDDVNKLAAAGEISFAVGVGDIAHDGTLIQYVNVTPVLRRLSVPFYPIMGNEEHNTTPQRFLEFAALWNFEKASIEGTKYVLEFDPVVLVFASPDFGRDFNDQGIAWILAQLNRFQDKPVFLIVHGAQAGAFDEVPDKGVHHPGFLEVVARPNLAAVISGDLHMDMDRVNHSKKIDHVHYLHIPALERTKIPDETNHTPMFRVISIFDNGEVVVDTYQTGNPTPIEKHAYRFPLPALSTAE